MLCPTCGRELDDNLGTRIRGVRKARGVTLTKLSELSKVSQSMLSDVENGRRSITIRTLKKIANALEVLPSALID